MKKKYQVISISLVILFVFAACDKTIPNEKFYYLSGYHPCCGYTEHGDGYAHSSGYYVISNDLKDTFLTFNLPNHLFNPTCQLKTDKLPIFNKLHHVWFNYGGLRLFFSFSIWFV